MATGLDEGEEAARIAALAGASSDALPRYSESNVITPARAVGFTASTTLKAAFWHATIRETPQAGDPDFASIALHTGGGRVWRDRERTPTEAGAIAMQPFEGADWRFEPPASFVHFYVPFAALGVVSQSLYGRPLAHADLRMPSACRDDVLCQAARSIGRTLEAVEPTNLVLDSWALILAEALVTRFSSHAEQYVRASFGKIPARGVAHVVDYVEAQLDQDLRLETLAGVAAMSTYHFARRFKETTGMSPHAYVLSRRVRRGEAMLRHSAASFADIAAACGFSSQAHFATAFKHHAGVTPGAYRRLAAM